MTATSSSSPVVSPPQWLVFLAEFAIALAIGWTASRIWNSGMIWLLSSIGAGAIVFQGARTLGYPLQPNRSIRKVGQAIVGTIIGTELAQSDRTTLIPNLPIFVILTLFLLGSGAAIGYFYARFSRTNLLTALLATVPGGVSIMASIAAEYNRNVSQVSLVQILRVTTVVILIPLIARTSYATELVPFVPGDPVGSSLESGIALTHSWLHSLQADGLQVGLLAGLFLLATGCTVLAQRCQIPAAPFVGGLIAGAAFTPLLHHLGGGAIEFLPPVWLSGLGQVLLGITIGEYWGIKPAVKRQTLLHALASVGLTLVAGFAAARLAFSLTQWDWLTCLLVTAPGGAPEIILVALTLNHHVETVTAGHLVRLIAINSSLPLWVLGFRWLDRKLAPSADCPSS